MEENNNEKRCLYCNKLLLELLQVDVDEESTDKLPFCDEQCMEAYEDENPNYFR